MDCSITNQIGNGLKVGVLGLAIGGIMWLLVPEKRRAEAEKARRKEQDEKSNLVRRVKGG
ncbi:MAG: hypothetical protein WCC69_11810 [Pirellulales bacterium]